jgi:acyl-CoA synthetase (AMP-forming)/AMP-acid ligase II
MAADMPALHVVRFVGHEPSIEALSWGAVFQETRRVARGLALAGVQVGDRVALSLSSADDFLVCFLAAQCTGAIPVPLPSLAELPGKAYTVRVTAVSRDARPRVIIVDATRAHEALAAGACGATVLDARHLRASTDASVPDTFNPKRGDDEIAFLQYTSGTTGSPKGVVVLHRNLMANLRAFAEGAELGAADIAYSWLPLFHDMGLVAGLLLGLYVGMPTYVASSRTFMSRPESWLRAITRLGATFSLGPNFAYDTLARRIPDRTLGGIDLRSWRLAFNGSEPVDPATMRAFAERFSTYGFVPDSLRAGYGLAEATLAASFPRPRSPTRFDRIARPDSVERGSAIPSSDPVEKVVTHTSVGVPVPHHAIRIVEIGGEREVAERHFGEIIVAGPSVTPGYFAELSTSSTARTELRTGDIGYFADGELYVVDRLKDLLVVAGRKYAPADIERVVGSVAGVRRGSVIAFGARGDHGTEAAYIVALHDAHAAEQKDQILSAMRSAVQDHFGLSPAGVFLVRPGVLPRTSSGKRMRSACVALLEAGAFAPCLQGCRLESE